MARTASVHVSTQAYGEIGLVLTWARYVMKITYLLASGTGDEVIS